MRELVTNPSKELQRYANAFCRKQGYGKADVIWFEEQLKCPLIGLRIEPGYRKKSTGEYVPKKYVSICRGKGIFYQKALTEVVFPMELKQEFI